VFVLGSLRLLFPHFSFDLDYNAVAVSARTLKAEPSWPLEQEGF
jgi:hypothetical protein